MTDNVGIVICPACGEKMVKIFLEEQKFHVDLCLNGCGGILFDNREFGKVDEENENAQEILKAYEGRQYEIKNSQEKLKCPLCGAVMVKNAPNPSGACIIDECYSCGAKFLDYGELEKARKNSGIQSEDYRKSMQEALSEIELAESSTEEKVKKISSKK